MQRKRKVRTVRGASSRLTPKERLIQIKLVGKLTGVNYKNPTKIYGEKFKKISRIFEVAQKYRESGYEFVPTKARTAKTLEAQKSLVRKIFPQRIPKSVRGVWIPKRVAGPNPRLKFDRDGGFRVGARSVPATDFFQVDSNEMVRALTIEDGMTAVLDKMLSRFGDTEIISPVSKNGGNFGAGWSGDKGAMKIILKKWIVAYGWAPPGKRRGKHDLGHWLAGFSVLEEGKK